MKKLELVFIPAPGVGHLVSQVEFARRLLDRDDRFSVTFLVMDSHAGSPDTAAFIKSLPASDTRITFFNLPHFHHSYPQEFHKSGEKFISDYIHGHKPFVKEAILRHVLSNSDSVSLAGLFVDFFCTSMLDIADEFGVPSYLFFTSGAAFLGLMLYLPGRHDEVGREFEDFDSDSLIPGYVNPVPVSVLPSVVLNKYGGYTSFLNHARRFMETKGIIVNTYAEMEPHAVESLSNNIDDHVPPVYTVGPLIDLKGQTDRLGLDETKRDEIMKWLDDQPASSVVFLCFGSMGSFGVEQVKEIAIGVEQSGQRFLWSLRKPPPKDKIGTPSDYRSDLREVMPNGFLERTKDRGMICGWAPQKEVLAHKSVGGFVSHCGWNSILESLWNGVPILTWPLYAEQQINAFQMVKDLGLGVELKMDYRNTSGEVVLGEEIARGIRCVMEEGENEVRKRVKEESEKSRLAVKEGGSSYAAYGRLIRDILRNNP